MKFIENVFETSLSHLVYTLIIYTNYYFKLVLKNGSYLKEILQLLQHFNNYKSILFIVLLFEIKIKLEIKRNNVSNNKYNTEIPVIVSINL